MLSSILGMSIIVVLCKGRKLNGAVSSLAPLRGALLSICSLPSRSWQFGPLADLTLLFPEGNESPNSHHMKIIKNASSLQSFYTTTTVNSDFYNARGDLNSKKNKNKQLKKHSQITSIQKCPTRADHSLRPNLILS